MAQSDPSSNQPLFHLDELGFSVKPVSRMNRRQSSPEPTTFICHWNNCGRDLQTMNDLVTHVSEEVDKDGNVCNYLKKWFWLCQWNSCWKQFPNRRDLLYHLRTHMNESPFSCKECGKSFSSNNHLVSHQRTHEKIKPVKPASTMIRRRCRPNPTQLPFKCYYLNCRKSFATESERESHKLSNHMKMKDACRVADCPGSYTDALSFQRHMIQQHGEPIYRLALQLKAYEEAHDGQIRYIYLPRGLALGPPQFVDGAVAGRLVGYCEIMEKQQNILKYREELRILNLIIKAEEMSRMVNQPQPPSRESFTRKMNVKNQQQKTYYLRLEPSNPIVPQTKGSNQVAMSVRPVSSQQNNVNTRSQGIHFGQLEPVYHYDAQKDNFTPWPANPTNQQNYQTWHVPHQNQHCNQMDMNHVGMNYAQNSYHSFEPQIYADHTQNENYNPMIMNTPMWHQSNGFTQPNNVVIYQQQGNHFYQIHSIHHHHDTPKENYNPVAINPCSTSNMIQQHHPIDMENQMFETNYHQAENCGPVAVNPTPTSGMIQQHNMISMKCHISDQHKQYHRAAMENAEVNYAPQPTPYNIAEQQIYADYAQKEVYDSLETDFTNFLSDCQNQNDNMCAPDQNQHCYPVATENAESNCPPQLMSSDPVKQQICADDAQKENCNPMVTDTAQPSSSNNQLNQHEATSAIDSYDYPNMKDNAMSAEVDFSTSYVKLERQLSGCFDRDGSDTFETTSCFDSLSPPL